jgi:hypothetical protein
MIYHELEYIFLHIPRCAGSSIKTCFVPCFEKTRCRAGRVEMCGVKHVHKYSRGARVKTDTLRNQAYQTGPEIKSHHTPAKDGYRRTENAHATGSYPAPHHSCGRGAALWQHLAIQCPRQLLESTPDALHAAWIGDYHADDPAPVHLVKAHQSGQVTFDPDLILTTRRPTEACLASLVRMGWLDNTPDRIRASWKYHQQLYDHWASQSDVEIPYEQIMDAPLAALGDLAPVIGLSPPPTTLSDIAATLVALKPPGSGQYDPRTLLHPNHRKSAGDSAPTPTEILQIIAQ